MHMVFTVPFVVGYDWHQWNLQHGRALRRRSVTMTRWPQRGRSIVHSAPAIWLVMVSRRTTQGVVWPAVPRSAHHFASLFATVSVLTLPSSTSATVGSGPPSAARRPPCRKRLPNAATLSSWLNKNLVAASRSVRAAGECAVARIYRPTTRWRSTSNGCRRMIIDSLSSSRVSNQNVSVPFEF